MKRFVIVVIDMLFFDFSSLLTSGASLKVDSTDKGKKGHGVTWFISHLAIFHKLREQLLYK